jgi:hypothetical protein
MSPDIRDRESLSEEDIHGLNFIRHTDRFCYRRHHFCGLRSHIFQVLKREDVENETRGILANGRWVFPKARPKKVLRIFRKKFGDFEEALDEIRRVKIIEKYLAPNHYARSNEFLVDYLDGPKRHLTLCGLQDFVEGERLDPWGPINWDYLSSIAEQMVMYPSRREDINRFVEQVVSKTDIFVRKVKAMILEAGYVPDLAGEGNLLITRSGNLKLVDINNVSRVTLAPRIDIDDKGYPVCDLSIVALSQLEEKILCRSILPEDNLYRIYLDPQRRKKVKALLEDFQLKYNPPSGLPVS